VKKCGNFLSHFANFFAKFRIFSRKEMKRNFAKMLVAKYFREMQKLRENAKTFSRNAKILNFVFFFKNCVFFAKFSFICLISFYFAKFSHFFTKFLHNFAKISHFFAKQIEAKFREKIRKYSHFS